MCTLLPKIQLLGCLKWIKIHSVRITRGNVNLEMIGTVGWKGKNYMTFSHSVAI